MQKSILKENAVVDGELRQAGEDVSEASAFELGVLEAHDKIVITKLEEEKLPELPAANHNKKKNGEE